MIVDPGGDLDRIQAKLDQLELKPVKILLTHGHLDHVGGTAALSRVLSLPVIGPHRDDGFWIEGIPSQAMRMGFGDAEVFEPNQWLNDNPFHSDLRLKPNTRTNPGFRKTDRANI